MKQTARPARPLAEYFMEKFPREHPTKRKVFGETREMIGPIVEPVFCIIATTLTSLSEILFDFHKNNNKLNYKVIFSEVLYNFLVIGRSTRTTTA